MEKLQYPEVHGVEGEDAEEENGKRDEEEDECDYIVFEIGEQKGNKRGDDSKKQDAEKGGEDEGVGGRGETEGQRGEIGVLEEKEQIHPEKEDRGNVEGEDGCKVETGSDDWGRREIEGADEEREKTAGKDGESGEAEREEKGDTHTEDEWRGEAVGEKKEDALSELLCISDSPPCPASSESLTVTSDPPEQSSAATWQDTWVHNLGIRDDLSDGHLSDCLQAELAIVYSDSDAGEDQWAAFPTSDVINQEEAGGGIHDGEERRVGDAEKQDNQYEAEVETGRGEEQEESGGRVGDEEQMRTRRDLFLRSPSLSSTASSTDPDRRVRPFLWTTSPSHLLYVVSRLTLNFMFPASASRRFLCKPGDPQ